MYINSFMAAVVAMAEEVWVSDSLTLANKHVHQDRLELRTKIVLSEVCNDGSTLRERYK